ncbi:hypothetical protein AB1Y20_005695 [Prymnesium parvum]|uniref:Lipoyl-binding domain-containing protein n=1 Tax=Prymnesium parvum TaxID=97485 RepID=A0AB34J2F8_PRYPA
MLFCSRQHLWVRLHRTAISGGLVAPRAAWRAEIGLTARGLQDVGTVHAWKCVREVGGAVSAAEPLIHIDWDGQQISDGDELYHTTWNTVEGRTTLRAPMDGVLLFLHDGSGPIDPQTRLAELRVDKPGLNGAKGLMNEEAYMRAVEGLSPGMFGGEEDNTGGPKYSRYG